MAHRNRIRACAECDKVSRITARGLCSSCYQKATRREKHPVTRLSRAESLAAARDAETESGCWPWPSYDSHGHAWAVEVDGAVVPTHVAVWMTINGPLPDGMTLAHTCHIADVSCPGECVHRRCVNPDHQDVVTVTERRSRSRLNARKKVRPDACSFEGCDYPVFTVRSGLCAVHWAQDRAGRPLTPAAYRHAAHSPSDRDERGRKKCTKCLAWKPVSQYSRSRAALDGLVMNCKACTSDARYLGRYGITPVQMQKLRAVQGGCCKICGTHESDLLTKLFVDHDHAHCGKYQGCAECVRGLLCQPCNSAIGLMNDSPGRLIAAAEYLRRAHVSLAEAAA